MEPNEEEPLPEIGVRSFLVGSYDIPKAFYGTVNKIGDKPCPAATAARIGILLWYADRTPGRKKRTIMDVQEMVVKWKTMMVGLCVAHDKDEADKYEASVEECLRPILTAPVKQLREFAPALLNALKEDKSVPYLVWRSFEVWILQMKDAVDDDIKLLKTDLAKEIVELVEDDVKGQLPDAMIRALQWRSPEKLEEMLEVVKKEKSAGRSTRLRGRESCLFIEAGGTEEEPTVCVQL